MINTFGHLPWLETHDLIGDSRPPGYALTLLLRACRIFPLEATDEQNDQALLDARHRCQKSSRECVPPGYQMVRWHPTPAGLGVKGGEARRSAALVGWPSYRQITVAAGGTTRKPP
jgi:hypothetical protein